MNQYIGVDIGKYELDVAIGAQHFHFQNNQKGISQLLNLLLDYQETHIVVYEPTGGYELLLVKTLRSKAIALHSAHANKVRHFAKSKGYLAKTDKLDARVIAQYGSLMAVEADEHNLSENTEKLGDLLKRREELLGNKTQESNRLDTIYDKDTEQSIKKHIAWLDKEIKRMEDKIKLLRTTDKEITKKYALLSSVQGVGEILACTMLAYVPELGNIKHASLTGLLGLAPYNKDSGTQKGKRYIMGGRSRVRKILYMSALSCIRYNKDLKVFYERLKAKGKPSKLALVAVMRKLVIVLNSVMKRQEPWQEKSPVFA